MVSSRNELIRKANFHELCSGYEKGCDFNSERLPSNQLASVAGTISETNHQIIYDASLEFQSYAVAILAVAPLIKEKDLPFRHQRVLLIAKNLKIDPQHLKNVGFLTLNAEVLENLRKFAAKDQQTDEQKLIMDIVGRRVVQLIDFILMRTTDRAEFMEVLLTILQNFSSSSKFSKPQKLAVLNRFFILDGHVKVIKFATTYDDQKEEDQSKILKVNVILCSVLHAFLTLVFDKLIEDQQETKRKIYTVLRRSDKSLILRDHSILDAESLSEETALMCIIMCFVDNHWKDQQAKKNYILAKASLILNLTTFYNWKLDTVFLQMLTMIYTKNFPASMSPKDDDSLQASSAALLKQNIPIENIDLSYLRWFKAMGNPVRFNGIMREFLHGCVNLHTQLTLCNEELFNINQLFKDFVSPDCNFTYHKNLTKVLSKYRLGRSCYNKLISRLHALIEQLLKGPPDRILVEQQITNITDLISTNFFDCDDDVQEKIVSECKLLCKDPEIKQSLKVTLVSLIHDVAGEVHLP